MRVLATLVAAVALVLAASAGAASNRPSVGAGVDAAPSLYRNCTNFNKRYRHGVGKRLARDRTTSGDPVTNFLRSTLIYNRAMRWNRGLDRDKDGVACEKH